MQLLKDLAAIILPITTRLICALLVCSLFLYSASTSICWEKRNIFLTSISHFESSNTSNCKHELNTFLQRDENLVRQHTGNTKQGDMRWAAYRLDIPTLYNEYFFSSHVKNALQCTAHTTAQTMNPAVCLITWYFDLEVLLWAGGGCREGVELNVGSEGEGLLAGLLAGLIAGLLDGLGVPLKERQYTHKGEGQLCLIMWRHYPDILQSVLKWKLISYQSHRFKALTVFVYSLANTYQL